MGTLEATNTADFTNAPATEFLDRQFPLRSGTHQDVSTYLVYFDHLMAIKKDGSTTSLVTPSQFQDADGSLDGPNAIVLSNGDTQVQIRLRSCRTANGAPHPCIDDVRIETVLAAS